MPVTTDQLLECVEKTRQAEEHEAAAAKLHAEVAAILGAKSEGPAFPGSLHGAPPVKSFSTFPEHSDTVDAMDAMAIDTAKRRAGAQLDLDLPFSKVAKRLGLSLRELATELREKYTDVRNWNSRQKMPDDVRIKLDDLAKRPKKRPGKSAK